MSHKNRPKSKPERVPDRLYHYTSIDSLAMILSTRKIKFNRLDLVNDPEEAATNDLPIGKELVFATCWTGESEESLPMWKMYTQPKRGVRISLPWDFLDYKRIVEEYGSPNCTLLLKDGVLVERESGAVTAVVSVKGPYRMRYIKRSEDHRTSCVVKYDDKQMYILDNLGVQKKSHWEFEKEWRYRVLAVQNTAIINPEHESAGFFEEMYDNNNHVKTKCLYVSLREEALQEMEIMIGPSAESSTEVLVNALLKSEGVKAKITRSEISINW